MASIRKIEERKFKITISNGYRPDGKKIVKSKTIVVPKSVQARSVIQYVHYRAEELEREVKQGFSEDGETTFEEFSLRWLNRQTKYAISTLNGYRKLLERTYPYIGHIKLNQLRPLAIENMLFHLRQRTYHGKQIQEATVQKYLHAVSAVLTDAKRNEIISKNSARMINLMPIKRKQQVIPSDLQIKELICALLEEEYHYRIFYVLAIYTGCRRGELCALKWSNFINCNGVYRLEINRSRSALPYSGVVEKGTKNNKERHILLTYDIWSLVTGYYYEKLQNSNSEGISDYLFTNGEGALIHPDTFSKRLRKIYDRLGFSRDFHLHSLRHYFVTTMLHSGVDKQTVAVLAGHGDTGFLERTYCHPQLLAKQQAAINMTNVLFNGKICSGKNGRDQALNMDYLLDV